MRLPVIIFKIKIVKSPTSCPNIHKVYLKYYNNIRFVCLFVFLSDLLRMCITLISGRGDTVVTTTHVKGHAFIVYGGIWPA